MESNLAQRFTAKSDEPIRVCCVVFATTTSSGVCRRIMTDDDFLAAFESCTLPFEQWNHRAHVRVAFLYATAHDDETATDRMRLGVRAYNKVNQVPESLEQGYHETVTQAFMYLICQAVEATRHKPTFEAFAEAWPELFDKRVLLQFYSRDRINSFEAKSSFVEPDLMPLSVKTSSFGPSNH